MKRRLNPLKPRKIVEFVGSAGSKVTASGNRFGRPVRSSSRQVPPQLVATPRVKPALLQFTSPHQAATVVSFVRSAGADALATASSETTSRAPVASSLYAGFQPLSASASACSRV